ELRNRVYHFSSVSHEQTHPKHDPSFPGTHAGLTRVCRQIRAEFLPLQRREAEVTFRWDRIEMISVY
ncbi:hypothetical protein BKA58DRAFT_292410, partial [Alternaria rosae]|uniref:uncharacterized protein n=1 Tax=Alternaria rosae TaxID=1187941 RepID=UPI001E8CD4EE